MTRDEQKDCIRKNCALIADSIIELIDAGKVPEEWDGFEMNWLIEEWARGGSMPKNRASGNLRRFQRFTNEVLVRNLDR